MFYIKTSFWVQSSANLEQYRWPDTDITTDVAILGSDLLSAFCVYKLAKEGVNVTLLCNDIIAINETTYNPGVDYVNLKSLYSDTECKLNNTEKTEMYNRLISSLEALDVLNDELGRSYDYSKKDGLMISNNINDRESIRVEHVSCIKNSLISQFVDDMDLDNKYNFPLDTGIFSSGMCCVYNPYMFAHALIKKAQTLGAKIYENINISKITIDSSIILQTAQFRKIKAQQLIVLDSDFVSKEFFSKLKRQKNYTLVTAANSLQNEHKEEPCIFRFNSDIKARYTLDNRIVINGAKTNMLDNCIDFLFENNKFNIKKMQLLRNECYELFGSGAASVAAHSYFGNYYTTKNGLPLLSQNKCKNIMYAVNGVDNFALYANIISDLVVDKYKGRFNQSNNFYEMKN